MRLPNSEHESRRWRIADIAPDFRLEDVWALPARGSAEDFEALLEVMASLDPAKGESAATRLLFSLRSRLGGWFGWDDATRELAIPGNAETTLSARLPVDLRNTATNVDRSSYGFRPLYRTDVEWAAELSNQTVHAVDAPRLGREGRGPVSRTDWGVRQAPGQARGSLLGTDHSISTSGRVPGADAADRTSLEHQTRTAHQVITSPRGRWDRRSAPMPFNVR
jgi:hypothetical protein